MKVWTDVEGDDRATGTKGDPFRTINFASAKAGTGGVVVVGDGVYEEGLSLKVPGQKIRPRNPGKVTVNTTGSHRYEYTAVSTQINDLRLHSAGFGPLMYADNCKLVSCEVTNWDRAIGVHVTNYYGYIPKGVQILGNRIHSVGLPEETNNFDHGIYIGQALAVTVKGNWIHDCWNRGVQMYPGAYDCIVTENVVDRCGEGIHFGGNDTQASARNLASRNMVSNSNKRYNIESSFAPLQIGQLNVADSNTVWMPDDADYQGNPENSGIGPQIGFVATNNRVMRPQYRDEGKRDYRIGDTYHISPWLCRLDTDA